MGSLPAAHGKSHAPLLVTLLPLLLVGLLLSSCAPAIPTGRTTRSAPPTQATAQPTATPTLPALTTPVGWKTVVSLGGTATPLPASGATYAGQFLATNTYFIMYNCEGSGSLTVTYPQAQDVTPCTSAAHLNGTQWYAPTGAAQTVVVTVQRQGAVVWNLAVEMQD